jgi:hypothetical protein
MASHSATHTVLWWLRAYTSLTYARGLGAQEKWEMGFDSNTSTTPKPSMDFATPARARPGWSHARSVSHSESILYGAFVWVQTRVEGA